MRLPPRWLRPELSRLRWTGLAVATLLALHWWMATSASSQHCTTNDEIAHLTAGASYWLTDDYRLQPENGNLPQRWAALPLLAMPRVKFPPLDQLSWRISDVWDLGFQFFYKLDNPLGTMLWAGRAMIALFSVATGWLVFWWARRLHGVAGALLAAALFVFSPEMLAHGALITSDMPACFCFLAAVTAFWVMLHRLCAGTWMTFGLTLDALALAKFSAPLILPMLVVLLAVRLAAGGGLAVAWPWHSTVIGRWRQAAALGGATLTAAALAILLVWAGYGFRYQMYQHYEPGHVRSLVGWDVLIQEGGPVVAAFQFARSHELLPESYLYGFAHTFHYSRYRRAFLNGDYRSRGWWWFFPYAFAIKTPLALGGLLGLAGLVAWQTRGTAPNAAALPAGAVAPPRGTRLYAWSPLLTLVVVYGASALTSHLDIGHRHILPMYPVLFIMAGGAAALGRPRWRWPAVIVLWLVVWFTGESIWIRPSYLAYFNELIGGPANGYRHLADSSIDWGQDLPGLKTWLDEHAQGRPVFLSYFGSGDPVYYGIHATRVADDNFDLRLPRRFPALLTAGLYCISATQFDQVYSRARGRWDEEKEGDYQRQLHTIMQRARSPEPHPPLDVLQRFEDFQFARLCYFLQNRQPIAEIGYSILVFDLDDKDVAAALYGPLSTS